MFNAWLFSFINNKILFKRFTKCTCWWNWFGASLNNINGNLLIRLKRLFAKYQAWESALGKRCGRVVDKKLHCGKQDVQRPGVSARVCGLAQWQIMRYGSSVTLIPRLVYSLQGSLWPNRLVIANDVVMVLARHVDTNLTITRHRGRLSAHPEGSTV